MAQSGQEEVLLGQLMQNGQDAPDQGPQDDGCLQCDASLSDIVGKCGGGESKTTWIIVALAVLVIILVIVYIRNRDNKSEDKSKDKSKDGMTTVRQGMGSCPRQRD